MRKLIPIFLLLLSSFFNQISLAGPETTINDYQAIFTPGYDQQGHLKIAIRQYMQNHQAYFLVVDPYTLATQVIDRNALTVGSTSNGKSTGSLPELVRSTPYVKALYRYTSPPYPLANAGLTAAPNPENGKFLTIDMCPSKKPFEEKFFKDLVALSTKNKQPVPIALSMSGLWIIRHQQEFDWLIQQAKANKLQITWINHSYTHSYNPKAPLNQNFMLTPGTNVDYEILETEKLLLAHNQVPSVFFRFPGLIADEKLILDLRKFSLIPVGSNAWLAKGEKSQAGSIILVHGNSNEHQGIELVTPLLNDPNLHLLPLSQCLGTPTPENK